MVKHLIKSLQVVWDVLSKYSSLRLRACWTMFWLPLPITTNHMSLRVFSACQAITRMKKLWQALELLAIFGLEKKQIPWPKTWLTDNNVAEIVHCPCYRAKNPLLGWTCCRDEPSRNSRIDPIDPSHSKRLWLCWSSTIWVWSWKWNGSMYWNMN